MKKTRTKHSPAFKAKVALAVLREQESVAEIARRYKVHANVVYKWKRQLLDNAAQSFETGFETAADRILYLEALPDGTPTKTMARGAIDRFTIWSTVRLTTPEVAI